MHNYQYLIPLCHMYDMLCYFGMPLPCPSHLNMIFAVFTKRGLEKLPKYEVPPSKEFTMLKPGTIDWNNVANGRMELFESAISRMREIAKQRRVLAKPCFQDFDR